MFKGLEKYKRSVPPPPPLISFLLTCLYINAFRVIMRTSTTQITTHFGSLNMHKLPAFGSIFLERGEGSSYCVMATIDSEQAKKIGFQKRKKLYLKTKDKEQALTNLESVKAEYIKKVVDALNEFDPLVAKAEELLELLVVKYVEGAKQNEMIKVDRASWHWEEIPINFNDLKSLRLRSSEEQRQVYDRLLRILRTETLKVLEYVNKPTESISNVGDLVNQVSTLYEQNEHKNKQKDDRRGKELTELREVAETLADSLEQHIEKEVTPYFHDWGMYNVVQEMKLKNQREGSLLSDDVLEKITMQSLGVSNHNAQRYKDIERVFNEFLDKHRDKIEGKIVEESRFRDIQAKWLEHEQKQSGLNKLRNRTFRQYELGQNDFVQRFGNVKLSDLNTKQTCKNFIIYLDEEYHKAHKKQPLANATIKNKKAGVSVLIDYAVEREDYNIDTNAWKGIAVANSRGEQQKKSMAWTTEMLKELFSMKMPDNYKLIFRIAYITGCRLEEASALQWSDIAPYNGVNCISLMREDLAVKGNRNSPNTTASRRIIPIVPILQDYLDEHAKNFKNPLENKAITGKWVKDKDGKISGDVSKKLGRYRRKVKLPDTIFKYNTHSFRNTFLKHCESAKIDSVVASAIVGHSQKDMRKAYGYDPYWSEPERLKDVLEALSIIDFSITKGK